MRHKAGQRGTFATMILLLAHISVVAGREAAFEALARELATATVARETGVRRYEYTRLAEPSRYLATLAFDDYEAFIAHQASEHHFVIAGAMRDIIANIELERVELVPGCSPLAEPFEVTPIRSLIDVDGETLADRSAQYRNRYPLAPSQWWGELR